MWIAPSSPPLGVALVAPLSGASAWQAAVTAFLRGGPVMWPLLLCSLLSGAIVIERLLVFGRERRRARRARGALDRILEEAARGDFAAAAAAAGRCDCGTGRVLAAGLHHRDFGLSDSLAVAANAELDRLRQGLSVLDTIITLAPLLGILGTVTGIIRSFDLLSTGGVEEPAAVTGGIAEALITTAAGLVVAIGTLVPFNYFVARVRRTTRDLEQNAHLLEVACNRGSDGPSGKRL